MPPSVKQPSYDHLRPHPLTRTSAKHLLLQTARVHFDDHVARDLIGLEVPALEGGGRPSQKGAHFMYEDELSCRRMTVGPRREHVES